MALYLLSIYYGIFGFLGYGTCILFHRIELVFIYTFLHFTSVLFYKHLKGFMYKHHITLDYFPPVEVDVVTNPPQPNSIYND